MSTVSDIQSVDYGPGNSLAFSDTSEHVFLTLPALTLNVQRATVMLWFYGYGQFTSSITNFIIRCKRGTSTSGTQFTQQYGTETLATGSQNFGWVGCDHLFNVASQQYVITVQQPTGTPNYSLLGGTLMAIAYF